MGDMNGKRSVLLSIAVIPGLVWVAAAQEPTYAERLGWPAET